MHRPATSVASYLASLPPDRRTEITRVRKLIRAHLPRGYEEGLLYGMIGWYVPLARYPETYNGRPLAVACLAAQKHHNALYLSAVYGNPAVEKAFRARFAAAGKKLDMGKSCVRFKRADALAEQAIADAIASVSVADMIAIYERAHGKSLRSGRAKPAKAAATPANKSKKKSTRTSAKTSAKTPKPTRQATKSRRVARR